MRWAGIRFLDECLAGSGVWGFWSFEFMMEFPSFETASSQAGLCSRP
jgi:hypothetical protein